MGRNGALAGRVKQAFGFELGFEAQKLLKQGPLTREHHTLHHQLQLTAGLVNAQATGNFNALAIAGLKIQTTGSTFEHCATHLAAVIFQRKIAVPTGRLDKAAEFTGHAHRVESCIECVTDSTAQSADRPNTGRGGSRRIRRYERGIAGHRGLGLVSQIMPFSL